MENISHPRLDEFCHYRVTLIHLHILIPLIIVHETIILTSIVPDPLKLVTVLQDIQGGASLLRCLGDTNPTRKD